MEEKQRVVLISEDIHQKLKIKAAKEGKLIKDLTNELFTEYLKDIKLSK